MYLLFNWMSMSRQLHKCKILLYDSVCICLIELGHLQADQINDYHLSVFFIGQILLKVLKLSQS